MNDKNKDKVLAIKDGALQLDLDVINKKTKRKKPERRKGHIDTVEDAKNIQEYYPPRHPKWGNAACPGRAGANNMPDASFQLRLEQLLEYGLPLLLGDFMRQWEDEFGNQHRVPKQAIKHFVGVLLRRLDIEKENPLWRFAQ